MSESELKCPQCQSTDFEQEQLGTRGSAWPVTFGSTLFKKKELIARACNSCGLVLLHVGTRNEEDGAPR